MSESAKPTGLVIKIGNVYQPVSLEDGKLVIEIFDHDPMSSIGAEQSKKAKPRKRRTKRD